MNRTSTSYALSALVILLTMALFGAGYSGAAAHPECRIQAEPGRSAQVPGPPGLPCLPTEVPSGDTSGAAKPPSEGPVRLAMVNQTEQPISLFLSGPETYVLNVPGGESRTFVVERGSYAFEETACGFTLAGRLSVTRHFEVIYPPCSATRLVQIYIENTASSAASLILTGPTTQVLYVEQAQTRAFSIPHGDYEVEFYACGSRGQLEFSARSHRTLTIDCP